jgi:hypothetical protein
MTAPRATTRYTVRLGDDPYDGRNEPTVFYRDAQHPERGECYVWLCLLTPSMRAEYGLSAPLASAPPNTDRCADCDEPLASAPVRAEEPTCAHCAITVAELKASGDYDEDYDPADDCQFCGEDIGVAPPAVARLSYDDRRDWYTNGQYASDCAPDADLTALTWGNHVGNPSGVGISHKKSVLPDDHEFIALLLAFDNAVCHNARLRGIDSVTDDGVDAKDGEWVDEDTPHEAIVDYVTALLAARDERCTETDDGLRCDRKAGHYGDCCVSPSRYDTRLWTGKHTRAALPTTRRDGA